MFLKDPDCSFCLISLSSQVLLHPYLRFLAGRKVKVAAETETKIGPAYIFELPEDVRIPEEIKIPKGGNQRYYQILKKFTKTIV